MKKAFQQMEKLFKEKLLPAVQTQVAAHRKLLDDRLKHGREIELYQQKIEAALVSCRGIQEKLDKEVLGGHDTKKTLRDLEIKSAEVGSFERHLESLAARENEAAGGLEATQKDLAEVLRRGILLLRGDVEEAVRTSLKEALASLIFFEELGLSTCKEHGAEVDREFLKDFPRFLSLDPMLRDLGAFCSPIGRSESLGKRRKVREDFLAKV